MWTVFCLHIPSPAIGQKAALSSFSITCKGITKKIVNCCIIQTWIGAVHQRLGYSLPIQQCNWAMQNCRRHMPGLCRTRICHSRLGPRQGNELSLRWDWDLLVWWAGLGILLLYSHFWDWDGTIVSPGTETMTNVPLSRGLFPPVWKIALFSLVSDFMFGIRLYFQPIYKEYKESILHNQCIVCCLTSCSSVVWKLVCQPSSPGFIPGMSHSESALSIHRYFLYTHFAVSQSR